MGKIVEMEYSRTFNLGDFESERISLKAELDEKNNLIEAFDKVKKYVLLLHNRVKD